MCGYVCGYAGICKSPKCLRIHNFKSHTHIHAYKIYKLIYIPDKCLIVAANLDSFSCTASRKIGLVICLSVNLQIQPGMVALVEVK